MALKRTLYINDWRCFDVSSTKEGDIQNIIDFDLRFAAELPPYDALLSVADLSFLITSRAAYQSHFAEIIGEVVISRGYSKNMAETLTSIAQELVINAVLHGNLSITYDIPQHDAAYLQKTQHLFLEIDEKLQNSYFAYKGIFVALNFFSDRVVFHIRDEGTGFNFETFKSKYDGTGLRKGMDVVFMLAAAFDYDENKNMFSIVVKDEDNSKPSLTTVAAATAETNQECDIGVLSESKSHFLLIRSILQQHGFKRIIHYNPQDTDVISHIPMVGLWLCLSDIEGAFIVELLTILRQDRHTRHLPVLCQKSDALSKKVFKDISALSAEFISENIIENELISRMNSQLAMMRVQKNLYDFYAHIKREVEQAKTTIDFFEKQISVELLDANENKAVDISICGTHTTEHKENDSFLDMINHQSAYAQGIYFKIDGVDFFVFLSLRRGLVSPLVLSTLKGFIEHLNIPCEDLFLTNVMKKVQKFVDYLLPDDFEKHLLCASWHIQRREFEWICDDGFKIYNYVPNEDEWYEKNIQKQERGICTEGIYLVVRRDEAIEKDVLRQQLSCKAQEEKPQDCFCQRAGIPHLLLKFLS